jgi:hypothetical protein
MSANCILLCSYDFNALNFKYHFRLFLLIILFSL